MSIEQFHELAEYVIEYFDEIKEKLSFSIDMNFVYQADDKQKTLIKIVKIPDRYSILLKADFLISFNEEYFDAFDIEAKNILIDQELALIEIDYEKGTKKIGRPNLITSTGVIKKYGVEAVERANQVRDLFNEQQAEKEKENRKPKTTKNNR